MPVLSYDADNDQWRLVPTDDFRTKLAIAEKQATRYAEDGKEATQHYVFGTSRPRSQARPERDGAF